MTEPTWLTASIGAEPYRTDIYAGLHSFIADEPAELGGADTGPTPYDYLLAALGGCTAMTLRMYADRKKWPLEAVHVRLRSSQSHEIDCEQCAEQDVGITWLDREIELVGPLSDEQRRRLVEIADRCPVKQTLERGVRMRPTPA